MIIEFSKIYRALRRLHLKNGQVFGLSALSLAHVAFEGVSLGVLFPLLVLVEQGPKAASQMNNLLVQGMGRVLDILGFEFRLLPILVIVLIVLLLRQVFFFLKTLYAARLGHEARANIQREGLNCFLHTDIGFYFRHNRAEIHAALRQHATRAAGMVPNGALFVVSALLILVYLAIIAILSPWLTVGAALLTMPLVFIFRRNIRRGRELGQELTHSVENLGREMYERLNAIRLVKMRGMEAESGEELNSIIESQKKLYTDTDKARLAIEAYSYPILFVIVLGTFYGAVEYLHMGLASLGLFIFIVMRMLPAIVQMNTVRYQLNHGLDAVAKIDDLYGAALDSTAVKSGDRAFHRLSDGIEFKNISFGYRTGKSIVPAIHSVSLKIERGQMLALVGRSGAGKSTTADLIPRFFNPDEGEILIDGVPAEDYDVRSLRRGIAYVAQEPILLDDSIRANLEYGLARPLTQSEIARVLEMSHAKEFVDRLPSGVETVIGEHGTRLSGGQRQRLSFARALASNPKILILDEPTSALDSESEAYIQETLEVLHGQITIVIIAHRLATIAKADKIVLMQNGRIVAQGKHGMLVEADENYRRLFDTQIRV